MTNYEAIELDSENPYGERIQLKVGLKNTETGEVEAEMNVGLSRHQVENYDIDQRLERYKDRLKQKL